MNGTEYIYGFLPAKIRRAIMSVTRFSDGRVLEIHICRGSGSSVRFLSKKVCLGIKVTESDMDYIISSFTGRAL